MIPDERVATYPIEDQLADLTDAIREAAQSGIDSPGLSRVLASSSLSDRSASMLALVSISSQPKGGEPLSTRRGKQERTGDEPIGEWGIGKGAIIAKGAVRIWCHDIELCFDYRDRRGSGPWADISGRDGQLVDTTHSLEELLVEIDHYEEGVLDPDRYRWRRDVRGLRTCFVYVQSRTGVSVVINGEPVDTSDRGLIRGACPAGRQ